MILPGWRRAALLSRWLLVTCHQRSSWRGGSEWQGVLQAAGGTQLPLCHHFRPWNDSSWCQALENTGNESHPRAPAPAQSRDGQRPPGTGGSAGGWAQLSGSSAANAAPGASQNAHTGVAVTEVPWKWMLELWTSKLELFNAALISKCFIKDGKIQIYMALTLFLASRKFQQLYKAIQSHLTVVPFQNPAVGEQETIAGVMEAEHSHPLPPSSQQYTTSPTLHQ